MRLARLGRKTKALETPTCVCVRDGGRRWLAEEELTAELDCWRNESRYHSRSALPVTADLSFTAGGTEGPRTTVPSSPTPPPTDGPSSLPGPLYLSPAPAGDNRLNRFHFMPQAPQYNPCAAAVGRAEGAGGLQGLPASQCTDPSPHRHSYTLTHTLTLTHTHRQTPSSWVKQAGSGRTSPLG